VSFLELATFLSREETREARFRSRGTSRGRDFSVDFPDLRRCRQRRRCCRQRRRSRAATAAAAAAAAMFAPTR